MTSTWVETTPPVAAVRARLSAWAAREASVLASFFVVAAVIVATLPHQLAQDGWLSLVAGREVSRGLPHADTLTALATGRDWIDQQWLAHLVLYGAAHRAGGIGALLVLHALVLVATFALGAVAARRLGGSPPAVALLLVLAAVAAPWAWQLRAQTLALPLAVLLVWLLAEDARRPSPRVLLALPLLVLWANVHGSVLLAAAVTVCAGVVAALRRRKEALVLLASPLAALASPYGPGLVGYYVDLLTDRTIAAYVVEWQPTVPGPLTVAFYLLALVTVVAAVRRGTLLERIVLALLVAAGVFAIRNVIWLALAALVLVPGLLSSGQAPPAGRPMRVFAAIGAVAFACAALVAVRAPARVGELWPAEAAARAAAAPGRVVADERLADWLLWEEPQLAGRVALDARFELFEHDELEALHDFYAGRSERVLDDASVVVLLDEDTKLVRRAESAGFRRVDGGSSMAVLVR